MKESQLVLVQPKHDSATIIKIVMDVDKQFILTVPDYERVGEVIVYNFRLEDTIKNKVYVCSFRFKDLQ
jgi:hypothetical protein